MAGIIVYHQSALPGNTTTATIVPTLPVNENRATGGKPAPDNSETQSSSASTPERERQALSGVQDSITGNTESSTVKVTNPAPRQQAIAATVKTEYPYRALGPAPNDPFFASSWAMQRTAAQDAWTVSTGTSIIVAVIDTGYALQHEDLSSQWATNTGETGTTTAGGHCWTGTPQNKASNGCDDDNNGYVDDWRGWNFVNQTNAPQAGTTSSRGTGGISHGTAVAGLVGAATNNGIGVASFNWSTKVMPLQALDDNGDGFTSGVIAAIYYAVDNGANVINLSLGGPDTDPALQPAIDYAYERNVVIVASAGNCGTTGDAGCGGSPAPQMMYPALNNHVIAVGATTNSDTRASFSSYGAGLDVVAPGSGTITSPLIDTSRTPYNYTNAYSGSLYGTSFSSPIVASIAALIKSYRVSTSVDDVTALIDGSATKVAGMNGAPYTPEYGHGVVNAASAMTIAAALNGTSSPNAALLQTGDYRSEHSFSSSAMMSSGCTSGSLTYCTVRATNTLGYDRYLPYAKTDVNGAAGWQWPASILTNNGEWSIRAVQSTTQSNRYFLFAK